MSTDTIQTFSLFLSITALGLVCVVFLFNIYLKLRKLFPITVNCWFCNTWLRVPFENRNSFDCSNCLQYNGFSEDGGYNKVIEAQYEVNLNKVPSLRPSYRKQSNGLCNSCNHNQQLKIAQLASFTPLKKENYDIEIEHFRSQLEKAYQLCKECAIVLKTTLLKEKASIFGNHVYNIQKKGQNLFLNKSSLHFKTNAILTTVFRSIQGYLALFIICTIVLETVCDDRVLQISPNSFLPYFELFKDLYVLCRSLLCDFINPICSYILFPVEYGLLKMLSLFGLLLQTLFFFLDSTALSIKVNQILCWMFIALTSWTVIQETFFYTHLFQVFCACLICFNSFYEFSSISTGKNSFTKLSKSTSEVDEYSDDELDISSNSIKSYKSFSASQKNVSFSSTYNNRINNSSPLNKTDNEKITAKMFNNASMTARDLNQTGIYSNIRNSLEDLHLGNSSFKLDRTSPISFNYQTPSPNDHRRLVLSPSKLKSVTQNSWVAGGFWRNEDGTVIPLNEHATLSRSSSQSSGFGSQIYERPNTFNNPFNSLPASAKTSLSGDLDKFSIASEPPYYFKPVSPPPTYNNAMNHRSFGTPVSPHFHTFGNIHKSSNQTFNEFYFPQTNTSTTMPLFSTEKPLGLFKLPAASPNMTNFGISPSFVNKDFSVYSSNPNTFNFKTSVS